jgi:FixJ family two-component response regulator
MNIGGRRHPSPTPSTGLGAKVRLDSYSTRMNQPLPIIAVVDDEESVRLALARLLRGWSFAVSVYGSGEEFLRSLATSRPACVILDVEMPGMSGRDVQRALSTSDAQLPIIIVTAYNRADLRAACLADGAAAYFTKPLRSQHLIEALECVVGHPS